MTETELKITLDEREAARLRRSPVLAELRDRPRRVERLVSIYLDTPDHALAREGVALRLRRVGRRWVQTVKCGRTAGGAGFFRHVEVERPAPGGRLDLSGPDEEGVYARILEAAGAAPLAPVFETRVERMSERLRLPGLGAVEFALDRGEVAAGGVSAPILEAEIELAEGDVGAVFALARRLFPAGPLRFATESKSERGYALAGGVAPSAALAPRNAGALAYPQDASVETAARDVFRDCFAQIAANLAVTVLGTAPEGPHQLRVGLRRLRTAFAVFGPSLGRAAFAPLAEAGQRLGRTVGRLRDLDVLIGEVVAEAAGYGVDAGAGAALGAALVARREEVRAEVRAALAGPETTAFVLDLLEFVEARGWLAPTDYGQTARLAQPVAELAPGLLDRRLKKVAKLGRGIEDLDAHGLHALRKELKKLRYTVETLAPLYPGKAISAYLKRLKDLQDTFGSLNDATMAAGLLTGAAAPGHDDAAAQRGAGFVLGTLAVRVGDDRPRLFERWRAFEEAEPFWR